MFRIRIATAVCLAAAASGFAADQNVDLKLREVTLFSSGVGFFEQEADVTGAAMADLRFRAEQINDILKSMVVQDFDGGSVGVVTYTAKDPLERILDSFGVDLQENGTLAELLGSLRGERIRIQGPVAMEGVILSVEKFQRTRPDGETLTTIDMLNILTDAGMQQLVISELTGIKLLNEKTAAELNKALAALATTHDTDKKSVRIQFNGQGQRHVKVSFLRETPIWKTSYRLVLDKEEKPFLQGWAIVENTTDEDWSDVRLSLVSGRPISFIMDLYSPIYINRPIEDLELYASLRSPEFGAGFGGGGGFGEAMAADASVPAEKERSDRALGRRLMARGMQAGSAPGSPASPAAKPADNLFALGESGVRSVAEAADAGELFQYAIQMPVSIGRQQSAMLPIVNENVSGEKVSIYSPRTHARHPLNGLRFKNSTSLSLMQGPVTLFEDGVYAGDAKLPDLKPGEERLVAYALDLATEVLTEAKPHPTQLVSIGIANGMLVRRHKAVVETLYTLKNKSDRDKTVLLEHATDSSWKLLEPPTPYEKTDGGLRFRVAVAAGKEARQTVKMERVYSETLALTNLDLGIILSVIQTSGEGAASPAVKEELRKVLEMRRELDRLTTERAAAEQKLAETIKEQERVRANIVALDKSTDVYQRQLRKLDTLETDIEQLREQVEKLRKTEAEKRQAFEAYLSKLTLNA